MIAQTSLLAYKTVNKDLGARQQQVFDVVEARGSASNEQIADTLKVPINYVTGRVKELRDMGYLGFESLTKNRSGSVAKSWSIRDPQDKKVKELDCEA